MSERQNIEIDYCPHYRGIWLDRGELDKIIEWREREGVSTRPSPSAADVTQPATADNPRQQGGYGESQFGHSGGHHGKSRSDVHHGSRHGSFLKRLFD